jgi:hypothetical protein
MVTFEGEVACEEPSPHNFGRKQVVPRFVRAELRRLIGNASAYWSRLSSEGRRLRLYKVDYMSIISTDSVGSKPM